jgi:hypothetical protein
MVNILLVVHNRHRMDVLVSKVGNVYSDRYLRLRLNVHNWLLLNNRLHYGDGCGLYVYNGLGMRLSHGYNCKQTAITFRPISKVEVVNMECVFQSTSSNMVLEMEMISLLHHIGAKEHVVTASMPHENLFSTDMRSELNPFCNCLETSFEFNSKLAFDTLSFLLPIYLEFEISGMSGLHLW